MRSLSRGIQNQLVRGRYTGGVGAAVRLNRINHALRVELLENDHRAALAQAREEPRASGVHVEERRRQQDS